MIRGMSLTAKVGIVTVFGVLAFIVGLSVGGTICVETVKEVIVEKEVYRFIDENQPVQKWIDPDNQAVVYIYPEGYTGQIVPLYSLVPPVWYEQLLLTILSDNDGIMPPEILDSIPKEWYDAIAPHTNLPEAERLKSH